MAEPRDSYGRCLLTKALVDRHYEIFLDCHPEIHRFFDGTDVAKYKRMLRCMHTALLLFADGDELARQNLRRVARKHSSWELDVPEELYEFWLTSLIDAVRECDPEFSPEVEKAWHEVARKGIDFFTAVAREIEDGG